MKSWLLLGCLLIVLSGCGTAPRAAPAAAQPQRAPASSATASTISTNPLSSDVPTPAPVDRLPDEVPWVFFRESAEGDEPVLASEGAVLALDGPRLLSFPSRLKAVLRRPGRTPLLLETTPDPLNYVIADPSSGRRIDTGQPAGQRLEGYAFNPAGDRLALLLYRRPRFQLVVVDLAAGGAQGVATMRRAELKDGHLHAWRDEGMYLTSSLTATTQLWLLDSGLKAPRPHAELPLFYYQLSRDMSTVFFAENALKLGDLRSGQAQVVADEQDYTMADRPPHDMTASGSRLAYIHEPLSDGRCRLVLYEKRSSSSLSLEAGPTLCERQVAWSSDDERLLLFGWERQAGTSIATDRLGLKLFGPDGQPLGEARLDGVPFSIIGRPHLTSDDHAVVMTVSPGGARLVSSDLQGSSPRQIGPALPAGSWLIYLPDER